MEGIAGRVGDGPSVGEGASMRMTRIHSHAPMTSARAATTTILVDLVRSAIGADPGKSSQA